MSFHVRALPHSGLKELCVEKLKRTGIFGCLEAVCL